MKKAEMKAIEKRIKQVRKDVLKLERRYEIISDRIAYLDSRPGTKELGVLEKEVQDIFELLYLVPKVDVVEV